MQLYFEQLDQEPKEEDMAYIRDKGSERHLEI